MMSPNVQDESGWDVVYSDGACKGNGQARATAGVGVWWGENDPRYVHSFGPRNLLLHERETLQSAVRATRRTIGPN
jgi:ribonuclease HI